MLIFFISFFCDADTIIVSLIIFFFAFGAFAVTRNVNIDYRRHF